MYGGLGRFVEVGVVIRDELLSVLVAITELLTSLLRSYPRLLLLYMTDELYWIATPYLHRGHHTSWRNHAVGSDDGPLFDHCSLKYDRIVPDIRFFL